MIRTTSSSPQPWARAAFAAVALAALPVEAADEDLLPPQIVHEPCEAYEKGKPFTVLARFYDDSPIFDPKVVYRTARVQEWRSAAFSKVPQSDDFGATIRARDLKGRLEYFIEAFDENGNGPARYGSPEAPVRVAPSDAPQECVQTTDLQAQPVGVSSSSGSAAEGAAQATETIGAAPSEGAGINAPRPPPPQGACDLEDPPAYCSPVLWVVVGLGAALAVGGGTAAGICLGTDLCSPAAPQSGYYRLDVTTPPITGVLGP